MTVSDSIPHAEPAGDLLQNRKLRTIYTITAILIFASNVETWMMRGLNALLQRPESSALGPSLIMLIRVVATGGLAWLIYRLPERRAAGHTSATARRRNDNFDPLLGLRAMACLMVMLGHFFMVVFATRFYTKLTFLTMTLFRAAPWQGVWIFFTLSGFLMGKGFRRSRYSHDAEGVRSFFRNRMLRILPVYLTATAVIAVFKEPAVFLPHNWWKVAQVLTFDFRGGNGFQSVGALWSVSTEVQFYLLVPLLFGALAWLHHRAPRRFEVAVWLLYPTFVLFRFLGLCFFRGDFSEMVYTTSFFNLDLFVVGMSLNFIPQTLFMRWRSPVILKALAATLYVSSCLTANGFGVVHLTLNQFFVVGPMLTAPLAALFILVSEASFRIPLGGGLRRICLLSIAWIGSAAYSLYVFHSQVYVSFRQLLPEPLLLNRTAFEYAPLCLGCAGLIAWIFHSFVEEPFEQRKRVLDGPITDAP